MRSHSKTKTAKEPSISLKLKLTVKIYYNNLLKLVYKEIVIKNKNDGQLREFLNLLHLSV